MSNAGSGKRDMVTSTPLYSSDDLKCISAGEERDANGKGTARHNIAGEVIGLQDHGHIDYKLIVSGVAMQAESTP